MKDYSKMTFEEYSEMQYKELRNDLCAFPEKEIKAFWDSEQEMVKDAYNRFIARYNSTNKEILLSDGLVYGMSLMF